MKIITSASYYGSGSSALTDLVAEYKNVKDLSDFEFRFLHDLDGIRDLEYHLVDNQNRQNSGHALKRFKKLCKFNEGNYISKRYSAFIDKSKYSQVVDRYINKLLDFQYPGWWFYDLYDKGVFVYYILQIYNHAFRKIFKRKSNLLPHENLYYSFPTKHKFIEASKQFIKEMLDLLNEEKLEYLEVDQLLPSSNIEEYLKYFSDEIFVFVVDRDPRDIYILSKYFWEDSGICPKDPYIFCQWYKSIRNLDKYDKHICNNIYRIQFEDLVYDYDNIVCKIENITGLRPNDHNCKFAKFNPKASVVNTRLWERYPNSMEISIIEKQLHEYLYDYSNINMNNIQGIDPKKNIIF